MPAKEIKELRQAGRLEEALNLAKTELEAAPDNIWGKRNLAWVYYDYLKQNILDVHVETFLENLEEIGKLQLPADDKMLFEQLCWQIGKMCFDLNKHYPDNHQYAIRLFETIMSFPFPKPSKGYSFMFNGLHKCLKDTDHYLSMSDWWDLKNFMPDDYKKEVLPNGKEMMALAEQAFIAYAKHLLPKQTIHGEIIFNKEKTENFLPVLSKLNEEHPQFQYPPYFIAKLLLALGDKENGLESLLPFAKKKRNDFWVWEVISEAVSGDVEKVFACYCKALSCKSPEEMLVSLRQKMAHLLIARNHYNEAKTEIDLLVRARTEHGFKIPNEVLSWQSSEWYKNATASKSNIEFYKDYLSIAEGILFSDIPEELVMVEFVNHDKKMLNFIASETRFGFFKYERLFKNVSVGDVLKVRFQGGSNEGIHQVYTAVKVNDDRFKKIFLKEISGIVKIPAGKEFGFIDDVFIHPSLVKKLKLTNGAEFKGTAIRSYNKEKKQWGWKLVRSDSFN